MNNRDVLYWAGVATVFSVVIIVMFILMSKLTPDTKEIKTESDIPFDVYDYEVGNMGYRIFKSPKSGNTMFIINISKDSLECLYLEEKVNQLTWSKK